MIFVIADTHFSEFPIIEHENRPFASSKEMDEHIIKQWIRTIDEYDEVYVLGDFGAENHESNILRRLPGKKYLVKGNHDKESNEYYRKAGFDEVYDHPIILDNFFLLSHEPMYVNVNMPYANIFGHVHASPIVQDYSAHHYCVSVERTNYAPLSLLEIKKRILEQRGQTV